MSLLRRVPCALASARLPSCASASVLESLGVTPHCRFILNQHPLARPTVRASLTACKRSFSTQLIHPAPTIDDHIAVLQPGHIVSAAEAARADPPQQTSSEQSTDSSTSDQQQLQRDESAESEPEFTSSLSVNADEITKFQRMSADWWSHTGKFAPLHAMQPIRMQFIRRQVAQHRIASSLACDARLVHAPFTGLACLDVGCGGGLLSEALCRLGAKVTGVDAGRENIAMAKLHAQSDIKLQRSGRLRYEHRTAESLLAKHRASYDVVCALEVVEHVDDPRAFIETCVNLVRPGGTLFVSTINKTQMSYLLAIVAAEYVLRWVPQGTHDWNKFVRPKTLTQWINKAQYCDEFGKSLDKSVAAAAAVGTSANNPADRSSQEANDNQSPDGAAAVSDHLIGCQVDAICGMTYNPVTREWSLNESDTNVNYILSAQRPI